MPSVRRRVRRIVRRRVRDRIRRLSGQLSARLGVLVLLFVSIVASTALVWVEPPVASACPVPIPKPLRLLYEESALVAVARVGDSVTVKTEDSSRLVKTALRISSLLKGESKERVVQFNHYASDEMDESSPYVYVKNDVLLVFLQPKEDGDGYVPTDYQRGVKKLSPDDLKVYVTRIEELALIMRSGKPDAAALTEWLVRCAEEPATRWEGAYELAAHASPLEDPKEESGAEESNAAEPNTRQVAVVANPNEEQAQPDPDVAVQAAAVAATKTTAADHNGVNESIDRVEPSEVISSSFTPDEQVDFAALLTPAQKERLLTTLLNAEELDLGEQTLLSLVGHWKDARLVPFSLKHLARMADQPRYEAEDLMRIVAHTLADRTLIKLVADYRKVASYEDLDTDVEDLNEDEVEDSEATAEERAAFKKEIAEMKAAAAEARFLRSGKLRHFLALADQPQQP